MNIIRIIYMMLIIVTFFTIFQFSNQDGEKSKAVSKGVMKSVVEVYPGTRKLNDKEKGKIIEKSQPFIRKLAHYSIYLIVGIEIMGFVSTFGFEWKKRIIITLCIGVLYAISDELHQLFSFGRTARFFDVFVDSLGVLTGSIIMLCVRHIM